MLTPTLDHPYHGPDDQTHDGHVETEPCHTGDHVAEALTDEPPGQYAVVTERRTGGDGGNRASQAGVDIALQGLLDVNAPVTLLRHERPAQPVDDEPDAGEDAQYRPHAAHEHGIDAEATCQPTSHTTDPPLLGADQAGATHGVKEAIGGTRAPRGLVVVAGGVWLRAWVPRTRLVARARLEAGFGLRGRASGLLAALGGIVGGL